MNLNSILERIAPRFLEINKTGFVYKPVGEQLRKNFQSLWRRHHLKGILQLGRSECLDILGFPSVENKVPFAWTNVHDAKNNWNVSCTSHKVPSHRIQELTIVDCYENAEDTFYKLLMSQKRRWCKLAQDPYRFHFTEVKKTHNQEIADIEANFKFGNLTVERIILDKTSKILTQHSELNGKTFPNLQVIQQVTSIDWGCLSFLCDTYTCEGHSENGLHRLLAPYKIAFYVEAENEKRDLCEGFLKYVKAKVDELGYENTLVDSQEVADSFLVPYTVVIDESLTEYGLMRLRSLSTTLCQTVDCERLLTYLRERLS